MLLIEATAVHGQPLARPLQAEFGEGGGSIGRGSACTLVLDDPDRHISRSQATISYQAGGFVITDTGTLNPVVVNGRALGAGAHARLKDSDELMIGPYRLLVHLRPPIATAPVAENSLAAQAASSGPVKDDPLAYFDDSPAGNASDPFADLLPSSSHAPQASAPVGPPASSSTATIGGGGGAIPVDFDPFADCESSHDETSAPEPEPQLLAPEEDINRLFELPGERVEPRLHQDWMSEDRLRIDASIQPDPLGLQQFVPQRAQGAVADHVPEIHAHHAMPPPLKAQPVQRTVEPKPQPDAAVAPAREHRDVPQPATVSPPARAATTSELSAQLAEAFLRGAGVSDVRFANGMTPEIMEIIGRILRESVQGTLDLLAARAQVKVEIHSSATVIVPRDNNPLKFSPNAEVALSHLLDPKHNGFMTPIRAMRDAYEDLRAHQIAVLAGMRAALAGVMLRFRPERLESKLKQKSMLDHLLPVNRKARQWDLFTELYRDISAEAEEDYRVVFGKEFRRAYEAQLAKFRAADTNSARG